MEITNKSLINNIEEISNRTFNHLAIHRAILQRTHLYTHNLYDCIFLKASLKKKKKIDVCVNYTHTHAYTSIGIKEKKRMAEVESVIRYRIHRVPLLWKNRGD